MYLYVHTAFKAALAEAEYQRREYIRVKEGKEHKASSTFKLVWALLYLAQDQHNTMLPGRQLI